jgi:hypothetical protein
MLTDGVSLEKQITTAIARATIGDSMKKRADSQVLKGIIHGRTIELEEETGRPDGQRVVVLVAAEEEVQDEVHAAETLQAIYRMRHMGRSILRP